jgi:hypothetical protein
MTSSILTRSKGTTITFRSTGGTMMTLLTLAPLVVEEVDSSQVNMTSPNKTRITLKVILGILG